MPYFPPSSSSGAPTDATYITQTANSNLSAEQDLGSLATGLMKVTTTTGVVSSVAAPAGAVVGTTDTQALTNKDLSSSTNTFPAKFIFFQWISCIVGIGDAGTDVNTTNTSYGAYYLQAYPLIQKPTGMKVYARAICTVKAPAGQTIYFRFTNGSTGYGEQTSTNTAYNNLDTGWQDVSAGYSNEGASQFAAVQYKVSAGTGIHQNSLMMLAYGP